MSTLTTWCVDDILNGLLARCPHAIDGVIHTPAEAVADILRIKPSTLRRWEAGGLFPRGIIRHNVRYHPLDQVVQWFMKRTTVPKDPLLPSP